MLVNGEDLSARYSPTRAKIYRRLLAGRQPWTVTELHEALADEAISTEAARATLYVLLGERLVEPVKGERALTVILNDAGTDYLRRVLKGWDRRCEEAQP